MPAKDPERRAAYQREYREKNRERARENQKRYQERNQEKVKEYRRKYYLRNRAEILKREADRYRESEEVREAKKARAKRWGEENPELLKARQKKSWTKLRYGLEVEEYDSIIARGCALCGSDQQLQIDHCHTTGKVRDALCRSCNTGLGHFGDDPQRLRAAARYLETHGKRGDAKNDA